MSASNTTSNYGTVSKTFHWLTALLILTAMPLGVIAQNMPFATSEELATKANLFSIHKTVGVSAFFVALMRILWALRQLKPGPLHPERRAETFLADLVHWSLYLSLVLVPLSGWLHHAASEGFAPILWPFGQSLPFVPKDVGLSESFGLMHWLFTKVLLVSTLLHVAGALKHVFVDRDATLRRMWFGKTNIDIPPNVHSPAPAFAAVTLWAGIIGLGFLLGQETEPALATESRSSTESEWQVTQGDLSFSVNQMGANVDGNFERWNSAISFDPDTGLGQVKTEIDISSLKLGSVTAQALGTDFFDVDTHPTALFTADIQPADTDYIAQGDLELRGVKSPVTLPFTLRIEGDTAEMEGGVVLDRRTFGMGASYEDESQVGFNVTVQISLTATR